MEGRPVAGSEETAGPPRGRVGQGGQQGEQEQDGCVAPEAAADQGRSWPDAICSEMRPNRNTTTASWISSAEPIGILPCTQTFQIP